jgi:Zn-finger nucleic acid-binding protein
VCRLWNCLTARQSYRLDNAYPVELLRCPRCGLTWVPEEIALGKMAEVEKTLEDK